MEVEGEFSIARMVSCDEWRRNSKRAKKYFQIRADVNGFNKGLENRMGFCLSPTKTFAEARFEQILEVFGRHQSLVKMCM